MLMPEVRMGLLKRCQIRSLDVFCRRLFLELCRLCTRDPPRRTPRATSQSPSTIPVKMDSRGTPWRKCPARATGTSSNLSRNCGSLSRTPSFPKNSLHRASNGRQTCRCLHPRPSTLRPPPRLLVNAAPATMSTGSCGNPAKGTPGWPFS